MFKKIIVFSFLVVYNLSFSQLTIVDEKFKSSLEPLNYYYLNYSDEIVIQKGTHTKGMSSNDHIKTICSYDKFSKKTILTENDNLMRTEYSPSGETIRATKFIAMMYNGKEHKYISKKKTTDFIKHKKDKTFKLTPYFNDEFEWGISNTKRKHRNTINFTKDDLIFVKTEIYSRKNNTYNIEKPNIDRLLGSELVKPYKKKLGYLAKPAVNSFFEIITKSISKDYRKCTVYKTYYDEKGEKVDDIAFNVDLKKYYFIYSMNNNSERIIGANTFKNHLAVNGVLDDPKTNDVYIYGLMGERARGVNFSINNPIGYYIFKFDKDGNKIWSKTQVIKDKLFNGSLLLQKAAIEVLIKEGNISVYNRVERGKDKSTFNHTFNIQNGEPVKDINKSSKRSKMLGSIGSIQFEYFLYAFDKLPNYKKKAFDANTIVALEEKIEISNYISNIKLSKNKILFNTIITDNGYWLIESDNKNYYKILFFNK